MPNEWNHWIDPQPPSCPEETEYPMSDAEQEAQNFLEMGEDLAEEAAEIAHARESDRIDLEYAIEQLCRVPQCQRRDTMDDCVQRAIDALERVVERSASVQEPLPVRTWEEEG